MNTKAAVFRIGALMLGVVATILGGPGQAQQLSAQQLTACNGIFALCTIAPCDPIPGNDKQVLCHCTVNRGYSAGAEPCQRPQKIDDKQLIHSRYYPVKSYAICNNDRPWAWCLDKPCIIDNNNPEAAACTCDIAKDKGDYVIVTSNYTSATCTTGVISSATVEQIDQATASLKRSRALPPFPIHILNK
jgi:hypothetical protein